MTPRWVIWLAGILLAAVIAAALYFPSLRHQVDKVAQLTEKTAEQARRELIPPAPVRTGGPWSRPSCTGARARKRGRCEP